MSAIDKAIIKYAELVAPWGVDAIRRDAQLILDGTPCNESRGWYGTKPGCKRDKGKKAKAVKKKQSIAATQSPSTKKTRTTIKNSKVKAFIESARDTFKLDEIAETKATHEKTLASLQKQFNELQPKFDKASQELGMADAFATPIGQDYLNTNKALLEARQRRDGMAQELMGPIRSQLLQNVPGINIPLPDVDYPIADTINEFAQITGRKGLSALKEVVQEGDRAWADDEGILNIGSMDRPANRVKMSVWHELGHFIEFEDPSAAKMAADWVRDRATGPEIPLNKTPGQAAYDDDELAYPDHFADPYIGKIYSDGTTEVISVGIENFVDEKKMLNFFDRDPDHFALMLGVLSGKSKV